MTRWRDCCSSTQFDAKNGKTAYQPSTRMLSIMFFCREQLLCFLICLYFLPKKCVSCAWACAEVFQCFQGLRKCILKVHSLEGKKNNPDDVIRCYLCLGLHTFNRMPLQQTGDVEFWGCGFLPGSNRETRLSTMKQLQRMHHPNCLTCIHSSDNLYNISMWQRH